MRHRSPLVSPPNCSDVPCDVPQRQGASDDAHRERAQGRAAAGIAVHLEDHGEQVGIRPLSCRQLGGVWGELARERESMHPRCVCTIASRR